MRISAALLAACDVPMSDPFWQQPPAPRPAHAEQRFRPEDFNADGVVQNDAPEDWASKAKK